MGVRLGEGKHIVMEYNKNKHITFSCQALGCDYFGDCRHIADVLDGRTDGEFLFKYFIDFEDHQIVKVMVPILVRPTISMPVWLFKNPDLYEYGLLEAQAPTSVFGTPLAKQLDKHELNSAVSLGTLAEGDSMQSIRLMVLDSFAATFIDKKMKPTLACRSPKHKMNEQTRLTQKLNSRGITRTAEYLRLHLTDKCTTCANKKVDFNDLVPSL